MNAIYLPKHMQFIKSVNCYNSLVAEFQDEGEMQCASVTSPTATAVSSFEIKPIIQIIFRPSDVSKYAIKYRRHNRKHFFIWHEACSKVIEHHKFFKVA